VKVVIFQEKTIIHVPTITIMVWIPPRKYISFILFTNIMIHFKNLSALLKLSYYVCDLFLPIVSILWIYEALGALNIDQKNNIKSNKTPKNPLSNDISLVAIWALCQKIYSLQYWWFSQKWP
jgi:hypothetical protein